MVAQGARGVVAFGEASSLALGAVLSRCRRSCFRWWAAWCGRGSRWLGVSARLDDSGSRSECLVVPVVEGARRPRERCGGGCGGLTVTARAVMVDESPCAS